MVVVHISTHITSTVSSPKQVNKPVSTSGQTQKVVHVIPEGSVAGLPEQGLKTCKKNPAISINYFDNTV